MGLFQQRQIVDSSGNVIDSFGGGGGAATVADAADVTQGAIADAAVAAGVPGTQSAKLRAISRDLGALTETAPATDTASSGLNGRLQRIAQRLTSILAGIPLLAGEAHVGQVGGHIKTVRVEKTRPADSAPYVINDVVNESTSAGTPFAMPLARAGGPGTGVLVGLLLETDDITNLIAFEVDIYEAAPATAINDNFEGTRLYVDSDKYLDTVVLPTLVKKTTNSTQADAKAFVSIPFAAADLLNIYLRLRTTVAFTPGSGKKYKLVASAAQD